MMDHDTWLSILRAALVMRGLGIATAFVIRGSRAFTLPVVSGYGVINAWEGSRLLGYEGVPRPGDFRRCWERLSAKMEET